MRFLEYETWKLKDGINYDEYEEFIGKWFKFIVENKEKMFPEFISAKYYRQTDRDGNLNGRYVMIFEYNSLEGHHEYKDRRKNWDGLYAEYKKVDPYQFYFDLESVTCDYMQPLQTENWFDYN